MAKKLLRVKCIKTFYDVLPNDILEYNKKSLDNVNNYPLYVKEEIYTASDIMNTISGSKVILINSKLRHPIGKPDYSHWVDNVFWVDEKKEYFMGVLQGGKNHFDIYFKFVK